MKLKSNINETVENGCNTEWLALRYYTLNKILVEVGQTGIKNESHLVKKLVTWGY